MSTEKSYAPGEHPDMAPPVTEVGVIGWVRHNLFSSTTNIVITVLTIYFPTYVASLKLQLLPQQKCAGCGIHIQFSFFIPSS